MGFLILLGLAIAPGAAITLYVYWKDAHDKEPLHLLVKCFFLGVLCAIPAIILELSASKLGIFNLHPQGYIWPAALHAFVVVAFSEELCKFVVLRWYAYPKADFNEPYDGIIYSVMISMGFATFENILYVLGGGFGVAILRMFLAVPAHATFAILMGYFVGLAKFQKNQWTWKAFGLLAAILFHGAYDLFLMQKTVPLLAFGAVVSLIVAIILSRKAMRIHVANSPFKPPPGRAI